MYMLVRSVKTPTIATIARMPIGTVCFTNNHLLIELVLINVLFKAFLELSNKKREKVSPPN